MSPIVIGLAIVLFAIVALIVVSMMQPAQTDVIGDRLSQFTERTMTLDELELQQPFSQRVLLPLTRTILAQLGKFGPKQSAERLKVSIQCESYTSDVFGYADGPVHSAAGDRGFGHIWARDAGIPGADVYSHWRRARVSAARDVAGSADQGAQA
jgi:hypothetical protein